MTPPPAPRSPLPARLLLAAHEDPRLRSRTFRTELGFGAAGAALLELVLEGRISVSHDEVVVRGAGRCTDPVVDLVLGRLLFAERGRGPRGWIERLGPEVLEGTRDQLLAQGLLMPVRRRVLGLFPVHGYALAGAVPRHPPDAALTWLLDALRRPAGPPRPECTDPVVLAVRAATEAAAFPLACSG
ncbi:GPP34 family phosphoprotein [Streptomyces sp. NK15101]|uniref:GOLPH3/VPS74 family protein n=1 Tax=Streptomyces sp. NK15101 TaxID=2873261 RepID=UPI001CECA72D|nr:GPP34 family phosphoprotein [Streptomyces sp. NK15101]